ADDLLTSTLLTARCPVLLAPAMHTEMWEPPATRRNVGTLRGDGLHVMPPASGRLTGADTGAGRLPEPADIARLAHLLLDGGRMPWDLHGEHVVVTARGTREVVDPVRFLGNRRSGKQGHSLATAAPARGARARLAHLRLDGGRMTWDLHGEHVVVTAGGTREDVDPVRFLGNRSSGKQGYALAAVAAARGARVTLVTYADLPTPAAVEAVPIESARERRDETLRLAEGPYVVIKAAAVADFPPGGVASPQL